MIKSGIESFYGNEHGNKMADRKGRLKGASSAAGWREPFVYDEVGAGDNAAQRRNDVPYFRVFGPTAGRGVSARANHKRQGVFFWRKVMPNRQTFSVRARLRTGTTNDAGKNKTKEKAL